MSGWKSLWLGQLLGWGLLGEAGLRAWRKLRPGPRPSWLDRPPLALPRRLWWTNESLLARLGLQPGMRVIEVGAGTGGLTPWLARAVGPTGQVLALDERAELLEPLKIAMLEAGLTQVDVMVAPSDALPPVAGGSDLIVYTTYYGGLVDKQAAADQAYRRLRQGGAVAITELLPDPDYCMASTVVTHLVLAGFGIEREVGGFANYTIIGRKALPSAERHAD